MLFKLSDFLFAYQIQQLLFGMMLFLLFYRSSMKCVKSNAQFS